MNELRSELASVRLHRRQSRRAGHRGYAPRGATRQSGKLCTAL